MRNKPKKSKSVAKTKVAKPKKVKEVKKAEEESEELPFELQNPDHIGNPAIYYNGVELARLMGVSRQTIADLKRKGHIPKKKLYNASDPQVKEIIELYQKEVISNGKKKRGFMAITEPANKSRDEEELRQEYEKLVNIGGNLEEEEGDFASLEDETLNPEVNKKRNLSLDEMALRLEKKISRASNDNVRKIIMQTLVNLEQYKKLQIETQKKKGDVVDKDQVRYFFNKYFNTLHEQLIELPSLSLSGKILNEIKVLEKRKQTKGVIERLLLSLQKGGDREELINKAVEDIEPKEDESLIKIRITEILEQAICSKINSTKEAVKNNEHFRIEETT